LFTFSELPPKVYVFGTGNFASRLLRSLNTVGVEVLGIVDWPERSRQFFEGYKVFGLQEGLRLEFPVVLGFHNPDASVKRVRESLTAIGVTDVISPPQVVEMLYLRNEILSNYWLSPQRTFPLDVGKKDFVQSMLSDKKSNLVFESFIRYRQTGEIEELLSPDSVQAQYFPKDIPEFSRQLKNTGAFVDVGAYTGDTLKALALTPYSPEIYFGLEPDLNSFQELLKAAKEFKGKSLCLPLAASDHLGWANFSTSGSSSAVVFGDGTPVQTANLDLFAEIQMSYVKMDIEGSELSALRGAESVIRRDKPLLAIAVYHKPEDLLEIPIFLASLGVYKNFYLRCYADQLFETVLYCLPN
jgi:FkbM family methyltransferase